MDLGSHAPPGRGAPGLNTLLWFIQIFLAMQYAVHGWLFISPPAAIADAIAGMGLAAWFRQFIGFAEIVASIGLVLPGLTRLFPRFTPLAAALGLMIVMVSATIFHIARNEVPNAISATNLLALITLTAYLRWKVVPIWSRAGQ